MNIENEYLTDSDEGSISASSGSSNANQTLSFALLSKARANKRSISDLETTTGRRLNMSFKASEFNTLPVYGNNESSSSFGSTSEDLDHIPHRCEPGFVNFGNTCYMNASLQCLLHCVPFVEQIRARGGHLEHGRQHQGFCILDQLYKLVQEYFRADPPLVIAPQGLYGNLREISQSFTLGAQQDAQEFIHMLFENINEVDCHGCNEGDALPDQNNDTVGPILQNTVRGIMSQQSTCLNCYQTTGQANPFLQLSLPIVDVTSVADAIGMITGEETLEGDNAFHCQSCESRSRAIVVSNITRAPSVLILQLNRFQTGTKFSDFVPYPRILDIEPFMSTAGPPLEYELVGVLVHEGASMHWGHYAAYIRVSDGHWCRADDERRVKISLAASLDQEAYLLFYQRREELLSYGDVPSVEEIAEDGPDDEGDNAQDSVSNNDQAKQISSVVAQSSPHVDQNCFSRRCGLC
ncbi:Ubiquitin carboxyl-terminal hydrolase 23 [Gracilariopsis chorda]|uniref:Ubiquitin carboxyl-terminal hydrolase n=1 Tax=Gracilariopsis chorda TaxID=448386 RepID=A0A2V3IG06_9FLOR|nr:Ubiquitin carboxyl-terminal hydrolase 23 [Gracilariopsis chorda]|eukprot:PXF40982.1 Ubiquitin carboxyl-terminal hydrolase 23 [Gracilariopsis chorda]